MIKCLPRETVAFLTQFFVTSVTLTGRCLWRPKNRLGIVLAKGNRHINKWDKNKPLNIASSRELNHSLPDWQRRKANWLIHLLLLVNVTTKHFSVTAMSLRQVFIILRHWHSHYSESLHWFKTVLFAGFKDSYHKILVSDLSINLVSYWKE